MSHQAIAAALVRQDVRGGERLVAFSLASFAGRDGRAWPGAPAAAARAGLSRSRYLHDRDLLVRRGLVEIEEKASGRGRSSTVALRFATEGPWWEGEINAELFEAALSRTCTRGPARLLLAAMAALADVDGVLRGLSNEELCAAAGLDDRTYRRARPELMASGELVLLTGARGRGNTNVWQVRPAEGPETVPARLRGGWLLRQAPGRSLPLSWMARALMSWSSNLIGRPDRGLRSLVKTVLFRPGFLPGKAVRTGRFRARTVLLRPWFCLKTAVRTGRFSSVRRPKSQAKTRLKTRRKTRQPTRARERKPRTRESRTPPTPLKGGAGLAR